MTAIIEIVAALLLLAGASVVALAALGVARLPDPFSRMHAAAKAGVAGAGLLLLGAGLTFGTTGAILITLGAVVFLVLTAPLASHALGRAAYVSGAPLGAASQADALAGILQRHIFDPASRPIASPQPMPRAPSPARPRPRQEATAIPLPQAQHPVEPMLHDRTGTTLMPLRRILLGLGGGPAQREAAAMAVELARPHGAKVLGLSGAGLEPRRWRGPLPVGGAYWAEWLASRSRSQMREAAATALAEFREIAAANPEVETMARHEEAASEDLVRLLAGQDLVIVPAGIGPHGAESSPGHETAATLAAAHIVPVLRVRRRPTSIRGVLLIVDSSPGCGRLAAGLLRSGLWSSAPVSILPVADDRRGVREMVETQAELLRDHGRRVAVMAPIDLDFEADDLSARLACFDAAVVSCLSTRYGGFFDSIRNCAFETAAESVPLVLLP
ncbi:MULTISPECIES: monovalent cation/H(+) antiporter subunit G [Roseomonadaceae]|uniref:Monovalent cation/H(+) antiporter subunit G n=1 Tax=Falsiroseomonas oleicola TaxID=2801474 RepID=A0ABS6H144_9PROT|nr:monovalent cation/H(+) antiporter subunit G [Roseomonas oleicola]MBU8542121.1 monovalent cation/H(+) antiporter subunit G [Roseomonas oleicola]